MHLLLTNDYPPKVGGIQTYLGELWRRLPQDSFQVLTSPHADAAVFDALESAQQYCQQRGADVCDFVVWCLLQKYDA